MGGTVEATHGRAVVPTGRARGLTKLVVIALALAFAYLSLVTAIGQSTRIWAMPGSGVYPVAGAAAVGELEKASAQLTVEGPFGIPLPTDPRFGTLAAYALGQEPASVSALRTRGFYAAGTGKTEAARAILLTAERLKKRDRPASLWLLQDSLQRNDLPGALRRFDQILRSAGDTRGSMLALMTELLSNGRSLPFLADMLRADPPWADQFWYFVARNRKGLDNAAELRRRLVGTQMTVSPGHDALLIGALVEAGQIGEAARLYSALTNRPLANGSSSFSFEDQPQLPPFDWALPSSDEVSARLDPKRSVLEVLAPPEQQGVAAHRLLRLSPGRYGLSLVATEGSEIGGMRVGVLCAGREEELPVSGSRNTEEEWFASVSIPPGCEWAWLRVIAGEAAGEGYNASIDAVRISPAAGEARTLQDAS